jgi:hypothetical protein
MCEPFPGTLWRHHNGNTYRVLFLTNIETERQDKYPTTVVYQNTINNKRYSRRLVDWTLEPVI